jgi:hypothetical protein
VGYLTSRDYEKIRKLIETFLDNPMLIDNLFKTLVLFLETKNSIPIPVEKTELKIIDTMSQRKVLREIQKADDAAKRFAEKLLKKNDKKRKFSRVTQ